MLQRFQDTASMLHNHDDTNNNAREIMQTTVNTHTWAADTHIVHLYL